MRATQFKRKGNFKKIRVWQPQEWEAEYERIVQLSALGESNTSLAEKFKLTKEHISNILNTEQARSIKAQIVAAIRQNSLDLMDKQYSEIVSQSVDNIHNVLHNKDLLANHPFSQFDRSIAALKGLGKLQEEAKAGVINNTNIQNNVMVISNQQETKIIEGLTKLEQIQLLHGGMNGDSIK
jgi:hypothetical protein